MNSNFYILIIFSLMIPQYCALGQDYRSNGDNHQCSLIFSVKNNTPVLNRPILFRNSSAIISFELSILEGGRRHYSGEIDINGRLSNYLSFANEEIGIQPYYLPYSSYCYVETSSNGSWHINCSNFNPNDKLKFDRLVYIKIPKSENRTLIHDKCAFISKYSWFWQGDSKLMTNIDNITIDNNFIWNAATDPTDAEIYIDNVSRGKTPKILSFAYGNRHIRINKSGFEDRNIELSEIEKNNGPIKLKKQLCLLTFTISPKDVDITVDGNDLKARETYIEQDSPHEIVISKEDYGTYIANVTAYNQTQNINVTLLKELKINYEKYGLIAAIILILLWILKEYPRSNNSKGLIPDWMDFYFRFLMAVIFLIIILIINNWP